jgi:REP element-mobilizing transposase RayT
MSDAVYRFSIHILNLRNNEIIKTDQFVFFRTDLNNLDSLILGIYEKYPCDIVNLDIQPIWRGSK